MYIYLVLRGTRHGVSYLAYFSSQTQAKEYAAMLFDLERIKQGNRKKYLVRWYGGDEWKETDSGYAFGDEYIAVESRVLDDPELLAKLQKNIREASHEL